MKQFRFPLDSVLRWRQMTLEQEQAKLQRLFIEEQRIALAIDHTRAQGAAAEQAIREQGVMVSTDLQSLAAFRLSVEEKRRTLLERKARQAALVEKQRQVVLEAERQFQLLVKLRERRMSEWQYEAGRETETFAQEAFLSRWNARKRAHRPKLNE
jgi:flagellar biosynthesis chaperone FliJ